MMNAIARKVRPVLDAASRPILPRHVKLRFDKARDRWVILAPERVLVPDDIAVEVLHLCDGVRRISDIAATLAEKYVADADLIQTDCMALLQDLADKAFLLTVPEPSP